MSDPTAINQDALVYLVQQAMAAGVACFMERLQREEIDRSAPLTEAFGDFPAEFLSIRSYLVDALTEDGAS